MRIRKNKLLFRNIRNEEILSGIFIAFTLNTPLHFEIYLEEFRGVPDLVSSWIVNYFTIWYLAG